MLRYRVMVLLLVALGASAAFAAGEWELLGSTSITQQGDHDAVVLMSARGDFRRIKLTVDGSTVRFHRIVVTFAHGSRQQVDLRDEVGSGDSTRAIDLTGNDHVIRKVDFWYEMQSAGARGATVHLFAHP